MVENKINGQSSSGGAVSADSSNASRNVQPSGGNQKILIIAGTAVLITILLLVGIFFIVNSLNKGDVAVNDRGVSSPAGVQGVVPVANNVGVSNTVPETVSQSVSENVEETVSLGSLLTDVNDEQVSDDRETPFELGMTISSLVCSDTSFDIEVTAGALPIEGVIFYFKDGTVALSRSELKSISPGATASFSYDVSGDGLDIATTVVEVKVFTLDGESGVLDSFSC